MKTLTITCLFLLCVDLLAANTKESVALGDCQREQLTASSWSGEQEHWTFAADGTLMMLDRRTQTPRVGTWTLTNQSGPLLSVTFDGTVRHYQLGPRCDQERLVLRAAAEAEVVLTPSASNAAHVATLAGDWQKGFSSDEPFLSFRPDGTYVFADVNTDRYQLRTGRWSVIGNMLVLYKHTGEVRALLIKHLQMDELVVSPFEGEREDWYLNKL